MKQNNIYGIFLFIGLTMCLTAAEKITILDHYRQLPEKAFRTGRTPLTLKNGVYTAESITEGELHPVVDIPNGYLRIEDPGTGGGSLGYECALFLDADKQPHVALIHFSFDGVTMENTFSLFARKGTAYTDRTAEGLPKMGLSLFLKDPNDIKRITSVVEKKFLYMIRIDLPRYGTDVKATLTVFTGKVEAQMESSGVSRKEKAECGTFLKLPKYETVIFTWDAKKAAFIPGAKK